LLYTWGLANEAVPVLEFAVERFPESDRARGMLALSKTLAERRQ
jgi:hypothetical protein